MTTWPPYAVVAAGAAWYAFYLLRVMLAPTTQLPEPRRPLSTPLDRARYAAALRVHHGDAPDTQPVDEPNPDTTSSGLYLPHGWVQ